MLILLFFKQNKRKNDKFVRIKKYQASPSNRENKHKKKYCKRNLIKNYGKTFSVPFLILRIKIVPFKLRIWFNLKILFKRFIEVFIVEDFEWWLSKTFGFSETAPNQSHQKFLERTNILIDCEINFHNDEIFHDFLIT
jgi:hypothetical protein